MESRHGQSCKIISIMQGVTEVKLSYLYGPSQVATFKAALKDKCGVLDAFRHIPWAQVGCITKLLVACLHMTKGAYFSERGHVQDLKGYQLHFTLRFLCKPAEALFW